MSGLATGPVAVNARGTIACSWTNSAANVAAAALGPQACTQTGKYPSAVKVLNCVWYSAGVMLWCACHAPVSLATNSDI